VQHCLAGEEACRLNPLFPLAPPVTLEALIPGRMQSHSAQRKYPGKAPGYTQNFWIDA
jgi:hypothetical protein